MRREELAHLLRAAAQIAEDGDILVVGSQAILGSFAEDELPEVAWLSVEADLAFLDDGSGSEKADKVDGAIGELSQFHETHSYYAQGVDLTTAKLPNGWQERLVEFSRNDASPAPALSTWTFSNSGSSYWTASHRRCSAASGVGWKRLPVVRGADRSSRPWSAHKR